MHCFGKKEEQKKRSMSKSSSSSSDEEMSLSDRTRKRRASLKRNSIQKARTGGDNFKGAVEDTVSSMSNTVTQYAQQISQALHRGEGHNNIGANSHDKRQREQDKHPQSNSIKQTTDKVNYQGLTPSSKHVLQQQNEKDQNEYPRIRQGVNHEKKIYQSS